MTGPPLTTAATLALIGVAFVWGSTFSVVKNAVSRMPPLDFLTVRFGVATAVMLVLRPRAIARLDRRGRRAGLLLGATLGVGYVGQTVGLRHTSAAVSGFITGMFVVFTPLVTAGALRRKVPGSAWFAVALATVGLALLSLRGLALGSGEALTLLCALAFAVHIVGLGEWSHRHDSYGLAVIQLGTVTVLCGVSALPGGLALPPDPVTWGAVALTGVLATAVAFVTQTWAQAHLSPTRTAVVMTAEPVFAGLFAVVVAGERLGWRTVAGGLLVLAAMYLVELGPPGPGRPAEAVRLE